MSQTRKYLVVPDVQTKTLLIRLPGDCVVVAAEEVVHFLGSEHIATRTRRRIHSVEPREVGGVVTFRVSLTEPFRGFEELDVLDAMDSFYDERVLSCV